MLYFWAHPPESCFNWNRHERISTGAGPNILYFKDIEVCSIGNQFALVIFPIPGAARVIVSDIFSDLVAPAVEDKVPYYRDNLLFP